MRGNHGPRFEVGCTFLTAERRLSPSIPLRKLYGLLMRSLRRVRSNDGMDYVVKFAISAIEGFFAIGIIGSAMVVILTSIEDSEVFFSRDKASTPTSNPVDLESQ